MCLYSNVHPRKTLHNLAISTASIHFRFTLPSHFIEPNQAYSSLSHPGTPLQENRRSQRRHQNNYEEANVVETSTFNPQSNVLPTLVRTLSDRRRHVVQSPTPYAEVGKVLAGKGIPQQEEFYEKVYDDGYHFDVEEVYDKVHKMPLDDWSAGNAATENPLYEKVELSDL